MIELTSHETSELQDDQVGDDNNDSKNSKFVPRCKLPKDWDCSPQFSTQDWKVGATRKPQVPGVPSPQEFMIQRLQQAVSSQICEGEPDLHTANQISQNQLIERLRQMRGSKALNFSNATKKGQKLAILSEAPVKMRFKKGRNILKMKSEMN